MNGISIVMLVLIFVLYLTLNILEISTVQDIERTLNEVAQEDSINFVNEYAKGIRNELVNTRMLVDYINFFMQNLQ